MREDRSATDRSARARCPRRSPPPRRVTRVSHPPSYAGRMLRDLRRHPAGLLAGAFAAVVALEVVFIGSALGLLPFAPFAFGIAVVDALPGSLSSAVIDTLQFWAKRLLEAGVVALVIAAGAYGGALVAEGETRGRALLVAAVPWALSIAGAVLSASRQFDPVGTTVASVVGLEAYALVMTSTDGYTDSIPIQKALEPTTLVVYGMNGDVLPVDHGYPARVLVPNIYGMKNVKWLVRLTVENYDYKGYWQERGGGAPALIVTK